MKYIIRKDLEGQPYQVVSKGDHTFRVGIYEIEPYCWNFKGKKEYGVNWSGCGTLSTKTAKDYAELITVCVSIANAMNNPKGIPCCVCGGPCEMDVEYKGSAVCVDPNCSVHKK